ncbi:hypothetical protein RDWZM_004582 [Blomia tropicalis]|uniref:Innexin n=1 Tax=Blomia tropicalis TaxID=40697 RepID=A0A9Q0RLS3_BLOTA|nr:hypothetical protein BLOT_016550 [Blomia tropicalis]KAJ6218770.1 hypothetical protein RDWZM_004582 [Blomia tropicalis]
MFHTCNRIFSAKSTSRRHSSSSWNHIVYDDIFFRFYYRFTCIILLILSIIIIIREWSVDSIDCNVPASVIIDLTGSGGELSYYRLNAYCRMHNRFIRYTEQNSWCTNTTFMANQEAIIPKYQWFALILFCSCILLYVPHLLWKCTNRSMIKSVIFNRFQRLRLSYLFRLDQLIKICLQSPTFNETNRLLFAITYLLSKLLNLLVIIGVITILNEMLNKQFINYPQYFLVKLKQMKQSNETTLIDQLLTNRNNQNDATLNCSIPYEDIFPKASICPYTYHDTKNSITRTVLVNCLMPINSLLEQLFLFLWLWFALVITFTLIDFSRYFLIAMIKSVRILLLRYNTNGILTAETYRLCSQSFSTWLFTSIVLINNQTFFDDRSHLHHSPKQHGTNSVGWNLEVIDEEVDDSNEYECIEMNSRRIT